MTMLAAMRKGTREARRDEDGAVTLWMLVWMSLSLLFMGLAIDFGNGFRTRAMLQATADAASHAGIVTMIQDGSAPAIRTAATTIAAENMEINEHGRVVRDDDVVIGTRDDGFTPGGAEPNAVQVTARREGANALATFFMRIAGIDVLDVSAVSISIAAGPDSPNDGVIARGRTKFTAQTSFGGEVCIDSEDEFQGSGIDTIGESTVFSAPDTDPHSEGGVIKASTGAYEAMEPHLAAGHLVPHAARDDDMRETMQEILDELSGYTPRVSEDTEPTKAGSKKDKTPPDQEKKPGDGSSGDPGGGGEVVVIP